MYPVNIHPLDEVADVNGLQTAPERAEGINAGDPLDIVHISHAQRDRRGRKKLKTSGREPPTVTSPEVISAVIREHAIISAHASRAYPGAGVPDWFMPAIEIALRPIQRRLNQVERRLNQVERRLNQRLNQIENRLIQEIGQVESRGIARLVNSQLTQETFALQPVIAANGMVPPHFPATILMLRGLGSRRVNTLLRAYRLSEAGELNERRARLGNYLGLYNRILG
ncbi:Aste57867_18381 [Aphanomyces stellatus]|uniref:Aste57867_18381 protein n=1 Tax=Aphanomyces stellatus TaxID=120398 RepID=A0A485LBP1_9STRA|nr:hypothetical protein As57867_018319 [Aphanomyces stellatus]VFT95117.1 Aste57867_18381 [Aphanomyces stellatus]